jgi:hypothetical protein
MSVQRYMMPDEEIRFSGPMVSYGGEKHDTFVTSSRLILYRSVGLFFKDNFVVSERLDAIKHIRYAEKGVMFKEGMIVCIGEGRELAMKGPLEQIREFYKSLLQATGRV